MRRVAWLTLRLTDWCQDKSTGNVPRKRRDITEQMMKAKLNTIQTNTNEPEQQQSSAHLAATCIYSFPHTPTLQHTALKTFWQEARESLEMKV